MSKDTQNFDLDPEQFGGTDYPEVPYQYEYKTNPRDFEAPLVTPEEEAAILKFYASNPKIQQMPVGYAEIDNSPGVFNTEDPWIQTYTGIRFTPTNPVVSSIVISDIAHSLSMQCRFSGHVKKFYSVAQHSVLVSYLCDEKDALWGLLHDASEAYLVDVPRPIKRSGKFDAYLEFETRMQGAICERFDLPKEEPVSVKNADKRMLSTEARDLMGPLHADWVNPTEPLPFKIEPLSQQDAKNLFMKRFYELTGRSDLYIHYLAKEKEANS